MHRLPQPIFDIYALSLPRGHAFGDRPPVEAWQSEDGLAWGAVTRDVTDRGFGVLVMRRRQGHAAWLRVYRRPFTARIGRARWSAMESGGGLCTALAWNSIVADVKEKRLNIDGLQEEQAKKELQSAEDVLPRVARECYKWLLCPVQATPADRQPAIEAFPLNTSGSALGAEIQRVCHDNELVISAWSPIHLRDTLKKLYWKDGKDAVGAMAFWEDMQRYLYLPRLNGCNVLEQAIVKGAASKDFFGTAYGQTGDVFEGFKFGDANIQFDDTLLLIEPEVAKRYETNLPVDLKPNSEVVGGIAASPTGAPDGRSTPLQSPTVGASSVPTTGTRKAKSFYGAVEVNPATAKMRLVQLAEEIISNLASDPQAELKITVEINADFPHGATDQIKRAVTENAKSLGFKSFTWE
jgi:hypothetical protein